MVNNGNDCGCNVERIAPRPVSPERATGDVRLVVGGMGCPNCANRVHNALVSLDGVAGAHVRLDPPIATVRYERERLTEADLIAAVARAGAGTHHMYRARVLL